MQPEGVAAWWRMEGICLGKLKAQRQKSGKMEISNIVSVLKINKGYIFYFYLQII